MNATGNQIVMGLSSLPPGCRTADLHRGVGRLDDLSPTELWALLDERQRFVLYREFFQGEWDELSELLDAHAESHPRDEQVGKMGKAIRALWEAWRNTAVQRMAIRGQITSVEGKESGQC